MHNSNARAAYDRVDGVASVAHIPQRPPLVSVVIPTHNRPRMLAEALASVQAQTFTDYEIIIVSNGETAANRRDSKYVASGYGCTYLTLERGNRSRARNAGATAARGEWIAILDDDDWWKPEKLATQLAAANDADLVFSDFEIFYRNGSRQIALTRPPDGMTVEEGLLLANYAGGGGSSALIRRKNFLDAGGFDTNFHICEDWDFWRRLSHTARIVYTPDVLHTWRQHRSNTTHRHLGMALSEFRVYRKTLRELPARLRYMRWRIVRAMLWRPLWLPLYLKLNQWTCGLASKLRPRHRLMKLRRWLRPRTCEEHVNARTHTLGRNRASAGLGRHSDA